MSNFPLPIPLLVRFRRFAAAILLLALTAALAGCGHFHSSSPADYVYVTVKKMFLRDRVAVIANHVAEVSNGERLKVVERIPRFLKVETPQGKVGWVEDHAVIDQEEYDKFQQLAKERASQKPVATAILYNELYMHIVPGRKTQHFYLLPINAKVSLLERASVARNAGNGVLGLPAQTTKPKKKAGKQNFVAQFTSPVRMEDWWLVRDGSGHTGWMLSRDLDVNVPEDVAQYAESEKMIGAYVLRTVDDPDSGKASPQVPEYVTVLTHYDQGLPYDFDQVRVFTWDIRRHRYGTAFRLRHIVGFFPVKVIPGNPNAPGGSEPVFSFHVAQGNDVSLDPATGRAHAAKLETLTFKMEGNLVHRVLPPGEKEAGHPGHTIARDHATSRHRHHREHRRRYR